MGMFSILYISTAYILTTDLKMMEKNRDDLCLSFFFFLTRKKSVLSIMLPIFGSGWNYVRTLKLVLVFLNIYS